MHFVGLLAYFETTVDQDLIMTFDALITSGRHGARGQIKQKTLSAKSIFTKKTFSFSFYTHFCCSKVKSL